MAGKGQGPSEGPIACNFMCLCMQSCSMGIVSLVTVLRLAHQLGNPTHSRSQMDLQPRVASMLDREEVKLTECLSAVHHGSSSILRRIVRVLLPRKQPHRDDRALRACTGSSAELTARSTWFRSWHSPGDPWAQAWAQSRNHKGLTLPAMHACMHWHRLGKHACTCALPQRRGLTAVACGSTTAGVASIYCE